MLLAFLTEISPSSTSTYLFTPPLNNQWLATSQPISTVCARKLTRRNVIERCLLVSNELFVSHYSWIDDEKSTGITRNRCIHEWSSSRWVLKTWNITQNKAKSDLRNNENENDKEVNTLPVHTKSVQHSEPSPISFPCWANGEHYHMKYRTHLQLRTTENNLFGIFF